TAARSLRDARACPPVTPASGGRYRQSRQSVAEDGAPVLSTLRSPLLPLPAAFLVPYLRLKRSTRPAVSTSFCFPVKNGWHAEQMSTWMLSFVERVAMTLPQAQTMLQAS